MTKNGKIILELIEGLVSHPTAEDVYRIVYDKGYTMSMATVYNNLNSLSEEGLIRRVSISNQPDRFDKIKPHDHLICKKCGEIKDICLRDRKSDIEKESGITVDSYDLKVYHICEKCS